MHEASGDEASPEDPSTGWHRGWFYRAVATDPQLPVLAVDAPFVSRWFSNVCGSASLREVDADPGTFGLVVLHRTLGGLPTLRLAFQSMHSLLCPGGVAVVAGYNRMRIRSRTGRGVPLATRRGYLRGAREAGFVDARAYAVRPNLDRMTLVIALERGSADRFFSAELAARRAAGRIRPGWVDRMYARAAPWLEPFYVVVARKC
jgi:hypothetical protein